MLQVCFNKLIYLLICCVLCSNGRRSASAASGLHGTQLCWWRCPVRGWSRTTTSTRYGTCAGHGGCSRPGSASPAWAQRGLPCCTYIVRLNSKNMVATFAGKSRNPDKLGNSDGHSQGKSRKSSGGGHSRDLSSRGKGTTLLTFGFYGRQFGEGKVLEFVESEVAIVL